MGFCRPGWAIGYGIRSPAWHGPSAMGSCRLGWAIGRWIRGPGIADSIIFPKALSGRPNRVNVIMRFKDALCPIYVLLPYLYRTHYGGDMSEDFMK